MKDFNGKVAVVTGGASGIGRAMAERFARAGMRVVLADVEEDALQEAEIRMRDSGADVIGVLTDVSRSEDLEALAQRTIEEYGAMHIVCNNAGVAGGGPSWEIPLKDWQWTLGVNLWGVINGVRTFVPHLLNNGADGHIVNTASLAGLVAGPGSAPYSVSKFGVVALSEALYQELRQAGSKVGVSVLCPGWVRTNILDSGRNHPDGPRERLATTDVEMEQRAAMVRALVDTGMPPADVADKVFDAIVNDRFYVLTHPEMMAGVEMRMKRILAGENPELPVWGQQAAAD